MSISISVAMATYNGEKYLRQQLDSIASQSLLPSELVICDDGSTDRTRLIIDEFASQSKFPVRLIVNDKNLGYAENFLQAARVCTSEWIAFSDQDDVWLPEKIECVARTIEKYSRRDLVLVGHTSLLVDANLSWSGQRLPDFRSSRLLGRASQSGFFCIVGFSMVFRAALLTGLDPATWPGYGSDPRYPRMGHDQWVGLLGNALGEVAVISRPLALWRRHDLSLTAPPRHASIFSAIAVAAGATQARDYMQLARRARETSLVLSKLAANLPDGSRRDHMASAAREFQQLSSNQINRMKLYLANRLSTRLKRFSYMVMSRCYFGRRMSSLGLSSMAKDFAYVCGLLQLKVRAAAKERV